jgi:hypothetical protein
MTGEGRAKRGRPEAASGLHGWVSHAVVRAPRTADGALRRRRRGTSLVEILVALVVLVIGIFSLVRLFPIGFGTILYGEGVTRGNALARAELERVRAAAGNMADGVVPIDPETGRVDVTLQKGIEFLPYPYPSVPGVAPDPRFSDLNRYRRVFGESTKVPAPTSEFPGLPIVNPSTGEREAISLYSVQFSPIYSDTRMQVYSGTAMERVVLDRTPDANELRELGEGRYGIDYRNAVLHFAPVPYDRQFRLEYSFTVPQGGNTFYRSSSVPDAAIMVPPNMTRVGIQLPQGAQLEVEEEQVYRAFRRLPNAVPFSRVDPYEFKVLNTVTGMMGFNPLGAAPGNRHGTGGRPLVAKLDYDVEDWHILREDRVVPQSGPFNVNLTLPFIKKLESIEENQQQYFGLVRPFPRWPTQNDSEHPGTPGIDLVIADLDTGLTIDSLTMQTEPIAAVPSASDRNGRIDYSRGRLEFNPVVQWSLPDGSHAPPSSIAGRKIRVYYRTEADWALQITKAFSNYRREVNPNLLGYGQYVQNGPDLYFPPIDHDHSVSVDYTWVQRLGGGQMRLRQESGELHKIKEPGAPSSPHTLGRAPQGLDLAWWIRLNVAGRNDIDPNEPIVIQSVRGASVIARAMWREGPRWRRLEQSTLLTR